MIKGAKSIAEYAIRKWILEQNLAMDFFILTMDGNVGKLSDQAGDSLKLVYDGDELVYSALDGKPVSL